MTCKECGKMITCKVCGETENSQFVTDGHKFEPAEHKCKEEK